MSPGENGNPFNLREQEEIRFIRSRTDGISPHLNDPQDQAHLVDFNKGRKALIRVLSRELEYIKGSKNNSTE